MTWLDWHPILAGYCVAPRTEENGIVYGVENGIVFSGKRVFFDCKVGYKLIGWDHTVCRSNGTYEHEPPLCVRCEEYAHFHRYVIFI